jgi:serine/threonine-protein kinase
MELQVGQKVGDYEVLGTLGRGGMGAVYKVRSTITERVEALKVLLPDLTADPDLGERFLREIRISAGLEHPNIAALRAGQRIGNQLLMVMEFVEGATLADLMREGRIPLDRVLDYVSQSLSALEFAHSHGVIHRDIKPSNIMVTKTGQVKLMDFGVARLATDSKLTKTGLLVGSLHYMSPEQIEGKDLDPRSDLYSLGVTFYEMVTGTRPFTGDSEYQIMAAHLKGAPQAPRELDNSLPPAINDLILTSMARDPARRFGSAKAMKAAVDGIRQHASGQVSGADAATQPISRGAPVAGPPRAQAIPVAAARSRSHRTTYMLIGSVATVAILVALAVYLPNLVHTRASEGQPPVTDPVEKTKPSAAVQPGTTVETKSVPATPQTAAASVSPAPSSVAASTHPMTSSVAAPRTVSQAIKAPKSGVAANDTAPPLTSTPEAKPVAAGNNPGMVPSDNFAELAELRDKKAGLDSRIAAVRESLDNMRRSQAQSGLSLRGDMASAEQRMFYHMNEADLSLRGNDPQSARKHLDSAEADLNKLEGFLGR